MRSGTTGEGAPLRDGAARRASAPLIEGPLPSSTGYLRGRRVAVWRVRSCTDNILTDAVPFRAPDVLECSRCQCISRGIEMQPIPRYRRQYRRNESDLTDQADLESRGCLREPRITSPRRD